MLTPAARQAWMSISVFSTGTASSVMVCQTKTGGVFGVDVLFDGELVQQSLIVSLVP